MNTQKIAIDKLVPNSWNPNVVEEKTQQQLMDDIKRDGFTQPIIVRPHPEKEPGTYEIIDGEHRWLAVKGLDWKEIDCIVEEKNDAEAMIRTITMNKLRGEFDSLKLAEVLVELKKTYTEEELVNLLGFTEEELQSYEELLEFDPNALDALATEDMELPEELIGNENIVNNKEFSFNLMQLDIIESAIEMTEADTPELGLVIICEAFLKNNFPDKLEEVAKRAKKLAKLNAPEVKEEPKK